MDLNICKNEKKETNLFSLSSDPNNEEDNNFLIRI